MNKAQLSRLLDGYVNGTSTPEESALIDHWLAQYQNQPDVTDGLDPDQQELLKSRMFKRIMLNNGLDKAVVDSHAPVKQISKLWYWSIAAVALTLICVKFLFVNQSVKPSLPVAQIHLVNSTKSIVKKVLSDGSTVWLSPNATLDYPRAFTTTARNVAMAGQCFFEITKNPKQPFIVSTAHMVTKVWGTSFRVTDYKGAALANVVVLTGKVSVAKKETKNANKTAADATEIMLHPAEEVNYNPIRNTLSENNKPDMATLGIWKRVNLSFNKTRLINIVKILNQNFQSNIVLGNVKLENVVMTADLNDLNLPELLEVLKTSLKLNYEVTPNQILLSQTN